MEMAEAEGNSHRGLGRRFAHLSAQRCIHAWVATSRLTLWLGATRLLGNYVPMTKKKDISCKERIKVTNEQEEYVV